MRSSPNSASIMESEPGPVAAPLVLTINETCRALSLSRTSVHGLIVKGQLNAVKNGTRTLVLMDSIRAFIGSLPRVRSLEKEGAA
jgi:hypothetical protein